MVIAVRDTVPAAEDARVVLRDLHEAEDPPVIGAPGIVEVAEGLGRERSPSPSCAA
ncbi:hypothetical protein [Saccharothrix obliqua]|uniref:hypothetical protein n=1 Tax=Saccharothrix obliqua TaxID=2861747 RepID=UPI001C5D85B1|nr:hypothetical protein [Saccharothrix obliqua]MBW4722304.1 hypothetical protein [Saccharothrix obliqua]